MFRAVRPATVPEIGPDAISITVSKAPKHPVATPTDSNILRVNANSRPGAIAGAIAGKAREGAAVLSATGIGPGAVLKIVKAIALAREYVKDTHLDIYAAPHFVDLKVAEEERTGVCFDIFVLKA
jgi:stage V sporulation protein SpoVS